MKNEAVYKFEWLKSFEMDSFPWKKDSPVEIFLKNLNEQKEILKEAYKIQTDFISKSKTQIDSTLKAHEISAILRYEPNGAKIENRFGVSSILMLFSVLSAINLGRDLISLKKEDLGSVLEKLIETGANVRLAQEQMPNLLTELGSVDYKLCISLIKGGWDPSAPLLSYIRDLHVEKSGAVHLEPNVYSLLTEGLSSSGNQSSSSPELFAQLMKECIKHGLDLESIGTRGYSALGLLMHMKASSIERQEGRILALIECGADLKNVNQHYLVLNSEMEKVSAIYAANQLKEQLNNSINNTNLQKVKRTI